MESIFSAIFEKIDDWYIGYVEELPGANTHKAKRLRKPVRISMKLLS
jgi:hypothetical protein